jgi:hypothetical protein
MKGIFKMAMLNNITKGNNYKNVDPITYEQAKRILFQGVASNEIGNTVLEHIEIDSASDNLPNTAKVVFWNNVLSARGNVDREDKQNNQAQLLVEDMVIVLAGSSKLYNLFTKKLLSGRVLDEIHIKELERVSFAEKDPIMKVGVHHQIKRVKITHTEMNRENYLILITCQYHEFRSEVIEYDQDGNGTGISLLEYKVKHGAPTGEIL